MAGKKATSKPGEERFITSASGIEVTKKGGKGQPPKTVKRSGSKGKRR